MSETKREYVLANKPNLKGIDLSNSDLSGLDLSWVNLERANLKNANLTDTDLSDSNLLNACLEEATLTRTCLNGSLWVGLDLAGAIFTDVEMSSYDKEDIISRGGIIND